MSSELAKLRQLLLWAVSLPAQLGFSQTTQPLSTTPPSFLSLVQLDYLGQHVQGVACKEDATAARAIALVEALERVVLIADKLPSSNGLAAHLDSAEAKRRAYVELLERDAFLFAFHWQLELPLLPESSAEVCYFALPSRDPTIHAVLCVLRKERPIYGMGADVNLSTAQRKAYFEASTLEWWVNSTQLAPLSLEEFRALETPQPSHHQALALDVKYQHELKGWPANGAISAARSPLAQAPTFEEHPLPQEFRGSGVVVYRARHPDLLDYYIGAPEAFLQQPSVKKLTHVHGLPATTLPHPFA